MKFSSRHIHGKPAIPPLAPPNDFILGCILGFVRRSFGSNDLWFTSPDHSPVPQFLKETSNINIINQGQSICFKLPNYSSRGRRKIQSTNKLIHRLPNL